MMSNFSKNDSIRYANSLPVSVVKQLEIFRLEIEKYYFSKVLIRVMTKSDDLIEIGIEAQPNFWLSESIAYFKNSNWLNNQVDGSHNTFYKFNRSLNKLRKNTPVYIDIAELSIYLLDTSLVIGKVYKNSISENYESVIATLIERMETMVTDNLELPTEIYLPLYNSKSVDIPFCGLNKSYFGFWGLYYDSEEDAVIYDVSDNTVFKGDLFMVDHIKIMENL